MLWLTCSHVEVGNANRGALLAQTSQTGKPSGALARASNSDVTRVLLAGRKCRNRVEATWLRVLVESGKAELVSALVALARAQVRCCGVRRRREISTR